MPDPVSTGASDLPPAGWTGRERLLIALLLAAIGVLVLARAGTRRLDVARTPLHPDVLVIHAAGLRADAATTEALANDLDFDPADMARWVNAFSQGTDAERSARCALDGDLVRDLAAPPGPLALPVRLGERGWRTVLIDDGGVLAAQMGSAFARVAVVGAPESAAAALAASWTADLGPVFAFVHLSLGEEPLHSDTTEAYVLRERYRLRLRRIREVVRAVARAARSPRPQLVVLLGANGMQLGEHPVDTELPWDERVRVPFLIGLRDAGGLPTGQLPALVQGADLAPTILDLLDLRSSDERAGDGRDRAGISLEPFLHGWTRSPVHEELVVFGVGHVAVRTLDWKLIAAVDHRLRLSEEGGRLFALAEDPGERRNLLDGREPGPVGERLLGVLGDRFASPRAEPASPLTAQPAPVPKVEPASTPPADAPAGSP